MSTTVDQLVEAVRDDVNALGLALGSDTLEVKVAYDAAKQPYEPDHLIKVCKSQTPERRRRFASGFDITTHEVTVAIITPGNDDRRSNLGTYASWRDQVLELFKERPADAFGLQGIRDVSSAPGSFLPPEGTEVNYDVQVVTVTIEVISNR